ncbi:hypothetical protein C7S16_0286 [Burkholderia thailandensis]|uniref:Uncharacterized protein n=1 Tax=Burkholderia thailandensis TaxID=57975 RepID=A0AAW9D0R9_BURTH|nr:hypothetical protein [Burkholderia thailandensis]
MNDPRGPRGFGEDQAAKLPEQLVELQCFKRLPISVQAKRFSSRKLHVVANAFFGGNGIFCGDIFI